jgi:hypothetical protein
VEKLAQVDIGKEFFGSKQNSLSELSGVGGLVSIVIQAAFAIAGIIFLFLLIGGGISIIAGAGNDNPEQAAKGKKAITSAIVGFLVVFAAYWIVQLIEELTGIIILG